jgi:glycosyltransferase involved in cell wall biosynthesis
MSNRSPLLSIVIPSFNQLDGLRRSLDFLSNSDLREWFEVIITDGGSTDGSKNEILHRTEFIDHIIIEPDTGIYDAMNKGLELASGVWTWFLGTGDLPDEDGFKKAINQLKINISKGHEEKIHAFSIKLLPPLEPGVPGLYTPDWSYKIKWRNTMHHQGMLYPTDLIKDIKYDLRFKVLADYHLNLKLWVMNYDCICSNVVIAKVDAGGVSRNFNSSLYREEIKMKEDLGIGGQSVWIRLKQLVKKLAKLTS